MEKEIICPACGKVNKGIINSVQISEDECVYEIVCAFCSEIWDEN